MKGGAHIGCDLMLRLREKDQEMARRFFADGETKSRYGAAGWDEGGRPFLGPQEKLWKVITRGTGCIGR